MTRTARLLAGAARWTLRQAGRLEVERVLLVGTLLGGVALLLVETPLAVAHGVPVLPAFALVLLHTGGLPAAARLPNIAAPVSLLAALALQLLTESAAPFWPWWPMLIVTHSLVLAAVAARTTLPVALGHWLVAVGSSAVLAAVLRPDAGAQTSVDVVVFGGVSVAAVVIVLLLAQGRRIRAQLLTERRTAADLSVARQVAEERTRIARELHDVVAHSLSIITVQASTARFRHPGLGEEAALELERIAAQSRQALDDMRGVLRVLRGAEGAERAPQPGLTDIADLVATAAGSGIAITLDEPVGQWSRRVGPVTGLTAFRIVQEATSNAIRHAPGSIVSVVLARRGDDIAIDVVNTAAAEAPPASGTASAGHGLIGMRERATGAGGRIGYGATPEGGFAVHALLPVLGAER